MPDSQISLKEEAILLNGATLQLKWFYPETQPATDKPILVLLHDSLGCIKLWRDFPEKLAVATGATSLVYDREGYGQSSAFRSTNRGQDYLEREADVLMQLLAKLQVKKAILFGHSDGGSIALMAAAKYKSRIAGVITEGAHVFVEEITLAGIRAAVHDFRSTDLPQRLHKYHSIKTDQVFSAWADTWLSPHFRSWNIEHFLPAICCPVLVVQGEADEYGTLAQVDAIVGQVQGPAQQLVIPGVGHTPHRQAGDLVLQKAAAFVASIL